MSVALSTRGLLLQDKIGKRIPAFVRDLGDALRDPRLIWVPRPSDFKTGIDSSGNDAPITWNTAQPGRLTNQGEGVLVTFDGANDYGSTPSNARYSFNTASLTDKPFSIVFFGTITSGATNRHILAKYDLTAAQREWRLYLGTTNLLTFGLEDNSVPIEPSLTSNVAPTLGSPTHLVMTYSGLGGALAMNGAAYYQNGVAFASTPTQQATYVAMETLAGVNVGIGARLNTLTGTGFFVGKMGLVALCGVQLSAGEVADVYALCKDFYNA